MGNSPDGLRMPEPWDDPPISQIKDAPFGFHGGVRCLIEEATHLRVAFR
jgi:hypothetical protein